MKASAVTSSLAGWVNLRYATNGSGDSSHVTVAPEEGPTMQSSISRNALVKKIKHEAVHGLSLAAYFASWFCALSFLKVTVVHEGAFSFALFGLAYIKAALCTKFLLIGEAVFPLNMKSSRGIIFPLLRHSFLYLLVVLSLNLVEIGVDGWIHGKGFAASFLAVGNGDPLRVLAIAIVYWLILCPYLALRGIQETIGSQEIRFIFFGRQREN